MLNVEPREIQTLMSNYLEKNPVVEDRDAVDSYFECITACSLGDQEVECITKCVEVHLKSELD